MDSVYFFQSARSNSPIAVFQQSATLLSGAFVFFGVIARLQALLCPSDPGNRPIPGWNPTPISGRSRGGIFAPGIAQSPGEIWRYEQRCDHPGKPPCSSGVICP